MTKEAIETIAPYLSADNVDLKSIRDNFYQKQCGARLGPVLETLTKMKQMGIWLEITTLLIPGLNDSDQELQDIEQSLPVWASKLPCVSVAFIISLKCAVYRQLL